MKYICRAKMRWVTPIALILFVGVALFVLRDRCADCELVQSANGSVTGAPSNSGAKASGESASKPVIGSGSTQINSTASDRFRQAATCEKVNQVRKFMKSQLARESSWVNQNSDGDQLSESGLKSVEADLKLVKQNSEMCDQLGGNFSRIYDAALNAALNGDADASVCYVAAQWPTNEQNDGIDSRLLTQYEKNAPKLADERIRAGDWRMVELLIMTNVSTTGGLLSRLERDDPQRLYALRTLKRLGAKGDVAASVRAQLAATTGDISREQRQKAEAWAQAVYKDYFLASGAVPTEIASCSI